MDPLTIAAASGLRTRMESLDILANNIANASSAGFKADREFHNLYSADEAEGSLDARVPVVERHWTDFSQGTLTNTGNPLDVAVAGQGFLVAQSPTGLLYTRNGSLRMSPGGQLQTQDGYPVLDRKQKPIRLSTSSRVDITPDGTIEQDGREVARLAVVNFPELTQLDKHGQTYFGFSTPGKPPSQATGFRLQQGAIENANEQPAETAVKLVGVLRQFEMLQKAMTLGGAMNKKAVEEVAKAS